MIEKSSIDRNVVSQILIKIQNSIESRNNVIKNLKYSIHHATKVILFEFTLFIFYYRLIMTL